MPYLLGDFANGADFWAVSQAIPAFPQKLTWGYSGHLPKSAPKTTQNSRLMSKSGPFSCRTTQNSRAATDAAQPQASEQNEADTPRECRPRVKPFYREIQRSVSPPSRGRALRARSPRRSYSAISMWGWGAAARSATVTPST